MANYATSNIRTVALVGQGGAGKTTLAEALLLASGAIKDAGTVERGTTVSDFDPLEKSWQHSLRASVVHLDTQDTRIHLIDTPGFPDFHRPGDRRARCRRDRGGRRQRAVRHRDDRVADDGLGSEAPPLPPRHRQQDRRGKRRSAGPPRVDPVAVRQRSACRSICPPAAASASSTASSIPTANPTSRRSAARTARSSIRSSRSTRR